MTTGLSPSTDWHLVTMTGSTDYRAAAALFARELRAGRAVCRSTMTTRRGSPGGSCVALATDCSGMRVMTVSSSSALSFTSNIPPHGS